MDKNRNLVNFAIIISGSENKCYCYIYKITNRKLMLIWWFGRYWVCDDTWWWRCSKESTENIISALDDMDDITILGSIQKPEK